MKEYRCKCGTRFNAEGVESGSRIFYCPFCWTKQDIKKEDNEKTDDSYNANLCRDNDGVGTGR